MPNYQLEIQIIATIVAVACALPGVFLVLRRMSLMSDAISHAILLGIVVGFFITKNIESPILPIFAALTGVLTVTLVELLKNTKLVKEDAAIGLVFPALFSLGVILVTKFAGSVHLDQDAVLLGELAFAPWDRIDLFGFSLPHGLVVMSVILAINVIFIAIFYKELKISTFDAGLATTLGFSPIAIHYALMSLVSITAVGAFDAVGAVLVVALIIAPPATAYLLTDRLSIMLLISSVIGLLSAISGFWIAMWLDVSIAGSMATMTGVFFLIVFLIAPDRGMVSLIRRRSRQRWDFSLKMLAIHILNHENSPSESEECHADRIDDHLKWDRDFVSRLVRYAEKSGVVKLEDRILCLTSDGRALAHEALTQI